MQLKSNRLTYTRYTQSDFEDYKRQAMDYQVMKYISGKACTEEEVKEKFLKIMTANSMDDILGYYSVKRIEDNLVIGLAKLVYHGSEKGLSDGKKTGTVEVGYSLFPEFWGSGYATEITVFLSDFAKSFPNIKEVIGIIDPENAASKRILTKCGYKLYDTALYNGKLPSEYYKLILQK